MAPKVTISVPDDLRKKMREWEDAFNWSGIFQDAVRKAIEKKESRQKKMREEDPKMEQVIERLREEMAVSEDSWFELGKDEGIDFAKNSHYDEIQIVVSYKGSEIPRRELSAYNDGNDDYFSERYETLGYEHGLVMDSAADYRFQEGWLEGVREFWNEIEDKI